MLIHLIIIWAKLSSNVDLIEQSCRFFFKNMIVFFQKPLSDTYKTPLTAFFFQKHDEFVKLQQHSSSWNDESFQTSGIAPQGGNYEGIWWQKREINRTSQMWRVQHFWSSSWAYFWPKVRPTRRPKMLYPPHLRSPVDFTFLPPDAFIITPLRRYTTRLKALVISRGAVLLQFHKFIVLLKKKCRKGGFVGVGKRFLKKNYHVFEKKSTALLN